MFLRPIYFFYPTYVHSRLASCRDFWLMKYIHRDPFCRPAAPLANS